MTNLFFQSFIKYYYPCHTWYLFTKLPSFIFLPDCFELYIKAMVWDIFVQKHLSYLEHSWKLGQIFSHTLILLVTYCPLFTPTLHLYTTLWYYSWVSSTHFPTNLQLYHCSSHLVKMSAPWSDFFLTISPIIMGNVHLQSKSQVSWTFSNPMTFTRILCNLATNFHSQCNQIFQYSQLSCAHAIFILVPQSQPSTYSLQCPPVLPSAPQYAYTWMIS